MNGFHEVRFPEDISYGSQGGPVFSTSIVTALSGEEQRNINWQQARATYNVAYGVRSEAQLGVLTAFFRARSGKAYAFRYKDWADYSVTGQILGTGDGTTTEFPLIKTYQSGEAQHIRKIAKPVDNSVSVHVDGVTQETGWAISNDRLIFATAPAVGIEITADFEFDVPVRFDTDALSIAIEAYGIGSAERVPLIEVRV